MDNLQDLYKFSETLKERDAIMPVLFVGHGSPMNAIEQNEFTRGWKNVAGNIEKPTAIICISAHWLTKGTFVTAMEKPKTIHDFYGFPPELSSQEYPAKGSPELAELTRSTIKSTEVGLDYEWGYDHGSWSVIKHMYPAADVPMIELSINYHQSPQQHYELAKELSSLRNKGVLIIGSGNMVHNLRMVAWHQPQDFAFDWAIEANETFKNKISNNQHQDLINYHTLGKAIELAIPTPDHYYPMLYSLGLKSEKDNVTFFNDKPVMGSLSMTSFVLGR
ncbi:4,5-DOPA dioxygenase extradiol [Chitinophagaceae bacterium LWZ2-11]